MKSITMKEARSAAADWVMHEGRGYDGYVGAYFTGSTVALPEDVDLPLGSDVDINLITRSPINGLKLGKFEHLGALLEVTYMPWQRISPAETVLSDYHLAGGFRLDTVIDDPTGDLRSLQRQVAPEFAREAWVLRRLENVQRNIRSGLQGIDAAAPWPDQVTSWLFPTGVTTHLLLVAALQNPTVRVRYLRARRVLSEYGRLDSYPELLRVLGVHDISPERAEFHVHNLARSFDAAASAAVTPFFFSSDITQLARPIAIDSSLEMIGRGDHREAMFWIVATFARCHKILAIDAPDAARGDLAEGFAAVLADLGIASTQDLLDRAQKTLAFLPAVSETAAEILAANPDVKRTAGGVPAHSQSGTA